MFSLTPAADELSNNKQHLSNSLSCWTMDFQIDEYLSKTSWKYGQFSHVPIELSSMYPSLLSLKVFYIDNHQCIVVETFYNNNVISYLKRNFTSFHSNLENVQFYAFSIIFFLKGWQPAGANIQHLLYEISLLIYTCITSTVIRVLSSFLAIKFQVMSMFCLGQKGHSSGYSADNFGSKRQTPKTF